MSEFDGLFQQAATQYGVPAPLLEAVARRESSLRPWVDPNPPTDGVGLMGMTEATARGLGYQGTREGLKDPWTNISLGAKYASQIIFSQGGLNLADFYSEYNSGRAQLWRTSTQVAENVKGFLKEFAAAVGVTLPSDVSIDAAVAQLSAVATSDQGGLLIVLALILYFIKRG